MCGIIGYIGEREAAPVLLDGLRRMGYRGYDSAGVGTVEGTSLFVKKGTGKVDDIHRELNFLDLTGRAGIGHTRWATHGGVTRENAHPQTSCNHEVAVVHNGIIENYQELKPVLESEGHVFKSETDSELIPHLIERFYLKHHDARRSILEATRQLQGEFAFLAIFRDKPDTVFAVRKDTPLIVGVGRGENFLASDIMSFINYTDRVIFLDNLDVAAVGRSNIEIYNLMGKKVRREINQVAWEASDSSRKEFAHHTLKEIHEQVDTVGRSLLQEEKTLTKFCGLLKTTKRIYVTGCGTSFHAGILARYLFARLVKLPSEVFVSSEFSNHLEVIDRESVLLTLSQSGETADVLAAVREAKNRGANILSIVNNPLSSLTRESNLCLTIKCGPEVGVAATKSFTSQLMLIYLIMFTLSNRFSDLKDLGRVSEYVGNVLLVEKRIMELAKTFSDARDFYFIGRGSHYPIALEGALKLKELSYIHAEGFPAGELKHGTLSLIEEGTPAVVINPEDETYHGTLSNAAEMKARGARIIGVSNRYNPVYNAFIPLPLVSELLYPIIEIIPLQMIAYFMALERHQNPDFPRNLAKSVTVK